MTSRWSKQEKLGVIAIVAVALALRLLHLQALRNSDPFFENPAFLGCLYNEWATRLAAGDWMGDNAFHLGPLYPYLLGLLYSVSGPSILLATVVQSLIGAGVCVCVVAVGRRLFDSRVALLAGAMSAVCSMLIFYGARLSSANLMVVLVLLLLLATLRALEAPSVIRWLCVGLLLGLCVLVRQTMLLLVPLWIVCLMLSLGATAPRRRRLIWAGLICAGTLLAILPVALRNHALSGEWVFVHAGGGAAFYSGNNPNATGTPVSSGLFPHWLAPNSLDERLVFDVVAEQVSGRELGPSEHSAFWFREGIEWLREHPADWLRVELRKFGLFWNTMETWESGSPIAAQDFSSVMRLPLLSFGVLAPFALLGVALTIGKWRRLLPLHAVLAVHLGEALIFFAVARDRVSVVPVLALFAAASLVWLWDALRARRGAALLPSLAGLGLACWVVHLPLGDDQLEKAYSQLGDRYRSLEQWDLAIDAYGKSLSYDPSNISDWAKLALSFEEVEGERKQAVWVWNHVAKFAERWRLELFSERAERHLDALGAEPHVHPESP